MKKNKTAKVGVIVVVLLLAVAFAAVTTQLDITGSAKIGSNSSEFEEKVVFATGSETKPYLMIGEEKNDVTVGDSGKSITFDVGKFVNSGDEAVLHYWVENQSTNYAAQLSPVVCTVEGKDDANTTYLGVEVGNAHDNVTVAMGETTTVDNTVTVKLSKTYVESTDAEYTITCTINATGVEQQA